jgi:hypothetical protein
MLLKSMEDGKIKTNRRNKNEKEDSYVDYEWLKENNPETIDSKGGD